MLERLIPRAAAAVSIRSKGNWRGPVRYLAVAAFLGCGEGPVTAPAPPPSWQLAAEPEVVIGGAEAAGPYALNLVSGARLGADGGIAAIDGTEIRVFDGTGAHVRTLGGQGGGPGEFGRVSWIRGDASGGLTAYDGQRRRLTTFGPDGALLAVTPVEIEHLERRPYPIGALADGTLLLRETIGGDSVVAKGLSRSPSYVAEETAMRILLLRGQRLDTLAIRSAGVTYFANAGTVDGRPERMLGSEPFSPTHYYAAGSDFMVLAPTHDGFLERFFSDGRADSIPLGIMAVAVDDAAREAVAEAWAPADGERQRGTTRLLLEGMTWPDSLPRLDEIHVDSDGRVWVRHFGLDGDTRTWSIYGSDGVVGRMDLPGAARLLDARGERLLLLVRDAFDVPRLEVRRVTPMEAGR